MGGKGVGWVGRGLGHGWMVRCKHEAWRDTRSLHDAP